jgi:hypothetical protein
MKLRSCITIVLILLLPLLTDAQQLVYDFNKGEFVKNDIILPNGKVAAIKGGGFVTLKVINVNTFRFNVTITGKSIEYVTEMPSELHSLFRIPGKESNKNTEQGNKDIATALTTMKGKEKETAARSETKSERLAFLLRVRDDKKNIYRTLAEAPPNIKKNNRKITKDDAEFEAAKAAADKAEKDLTAAQTEAEKIDAFQEAMKNLVAACEEYIEMAGKIAIIKLRKVELINLCRQDWESYAKMAENIPSPIAREDMLLYFKKFSEYYAEARALYATAFIAAVNDSDKKTVADAQQLLEEGHKKISEDDLLKLIEDVDMLQKAIENPKTFTVVSPPIQIDGDFVFLKTKAEPAKAADLMNFLPAKEFPVEIPVQGGIKLDFSVGPVISIGKKAKNELYFTEAAGLDNTKDDTVIFRQRNNNNAISPGIAAMIHAYRRSGRNFALGGMFGVGAGFKDSAKIDFSLFFGASLIMGKREKLMLSAGISYLRVSRLKDIEFIPGNIYPAAKIDIGNITEKVFKPSFFFSISYNITNRQDVR